MSKRADPAKTANETSYTVNGVIAQLRTIIRTVRSDITEQRADRAGGEWRDLRHLAVMSAVVGAVPPETALWVMLAAEMIAVANAETMLLHRPEAAEIELGPMALVDHLSIAVDAEKSHLAAIGGRDLALASLADSQACAQQVLSAAEDRNGGLGRHVGGYALDEADGSEQDYAPGRDVRRPDPSRTARQWLVFMAVS
jgi:hypothetical protein